jgi:uncharacterized phiE125 gp8 family phage protein
VGNLAIVTPPSGEPISVSDVKAFTRVDTQLDDDVLAGLITTARQNFDGREPWFGRALLTQTWDYFLPEFPYECDNDDEDYLPGIRVPLPPLQSVISITYLDPSGVLQTLATSDYVVDVNAVPGRIVPAFGIFWPSTQSMPNAVRVRFTAGYGLIGAVPAEIKTWLKQCVAYLYENREAPQIPLTFLWAMAKYKVNWKF